MRFSRSLVELVLEVDVVGVMLAAVVVPLDDVFGDLRINWRCECCCCCDCWLPLFANTGDIFGFRSRFSKGEG